MNLHIRASYHATDGRCPESIEVEVEGADPGDGRASTFVIEVVAALGQVGQPVEVVTELHETASDTIKTDLSLTAWHEGYQRGKADAALLARDDKPGGRGAPFATDPADRLPFTTGDNTCSDCGGPWDERHKYGELCPGDETTPDAPSALKLPPGFAANFGLGGKQWKQRPRKHVWSIGDTSEQCTRCGMTRSDWVDGRVSHPCTGWGA